LYPRIGVDGSNEVGQIDDATQEIAQLVEVSC
jgi:hypothetical protein